MRRFIIGVVPGTRAHGVLDTVTQSWQRPARPGKTFAARLADKLNGTPRPGRRRVPGEPQP